MMNQNDDNTAEYHHIQRRAHEGDVQRMAIIFEGSDSLHNHYKDILEKKYTERGQNQCRQSWPLNGRGYTIITNYKEGNNAAINPQTKHLILDIAYSTDINGFPIEKKQSFDDNNHEYQYTNGLWDVLKNAIIAHGVSPNQLKTLTIRINTNDHALKERNGKSLEHCLQLLSKEIGCPIFLQVPKDDYVMAQGSFKRLNGATEYMAVPMKSDGDKGKEYIRGWAAGTLEKDKYFNYYVIDKGNPKEQILHSDYADRIDLSKNGHQWQKNAVDVGPEVIDTTYSYNYVMPEYAMLQNNNNNITYNNFQGQQVTVPNTTTTNAEFENTTTTDYNQLQYGMNENNILVPETTIQTQTTTNDNQDYNSDIPFDTTQIDTTTNFDTTQIDTTMNNTTSAEFGTTTTTTDYNNQFDFGGVTNAEFGTTINDNNIISYTTDQNLDVINKETNYNQNLY